MRGSKIMRKPYSTTQIAVLLTFAVTAFAMALPAGAARIKDIAVVQGVRGNQLVGYGLVVGLAGTGDSQQVGFTPQSVGAMLNRLGLNVPANTLRLKNVAAVMVTADLPAFVKTGSMIDVTVSSIGDAASLQGGTLLQTPLQAANGQTYAVAQGSISVGGFTAGSGGGGGSVRSNHVTAGRMPNGAYVERDVPTTLANNATLAITLGQPDFTTAVRVADVINDNLPTGVTNARAIDAATVQVAFQPSTDPIGIVANIEDLEVDPDVCAKIVINERTGTVVLGGDVSVSACAIAQGNLTVRIDDDTSVSQPAAVSGGSTVVVPKSKVTVTQTERHLIGINDSPTIARVVRALNALGVTPRDLISILQTMKQAGALHADLEIE
ncbi:MAG: flagellar basal body P-ring protein FlgI [Capsulimonadaceae bacterium]|nr:flagellar basal body P-ring protein FlgI [Capsulimonadaceae bacterium]